MSRFIRITNAIAGNIVKHSDTEILIEVKEHVDITPVLWVQMFDSDPRAGKFKTISGQYLLVKKRGLQMGKNAA